MKTFVKWIIAGAIILGIGLVIMLCGLAANGWKWGTTEDFEQKEYTAANTVSAYDIRIAAGTVKVEFTDSDRVCISYPESKHFGYNITEGNGKLTLAYNKSVNFFFGWFIPTNIPDTVIKVPYGATDFDISINAGKLVLPDGTYGRIDAELNAGKFEAGAISCGEFDFDLNAGTAELTSVGCSNLGINVNAGSITLGKAACNKLTVEVNAGSADVNGVKCSDISVDVAAGSASIAVDGAKSEYNISVDRSAGSCNVSAQSGTDPTKRIIIDVSAGSAAVTFSN